MAKKEEFNPAVRFFIPIIGIVVVAIVLKELEDIFLPFVIAYLLFFLFAPFNDYLQKHKLPAYAVIMIDILIMIIFVWGISYFIIGSFINFGKQAPDYFDKLDKIVSDTAISLKIRDYSLRHFSIQKLISKIDYKLLAGGIFASTFSLLGNLLLILFFFIFITTGHKALYETIKNHYVHKKVKQDLKRLKRKYQSLQQSSGSDFNQWLNDNLNLERQAKEEKLANTFKSITEKIQRYIIFKTALNIAAGTCVYIFLAILGVDFPIIWGLFVFLFNFIPTIGSAVALALPVIMVLLQFESVTFAIIVALIISSIQTIFFNLIEPNVIGKQLNLNPILILLSVLIWGYIWGIIGMLLAVPLTAIIKITISNSDSKNLHFISDLMS